MDNTKYQSKISSLLRGNNVLVTGGAGFVGSHLCDRLLQMAAQVVVVDDLSTGKKENLADALVTKKLIFIKGNANQAPVLKKVFARYQPKYVFHLAAMVGVLRTLKDPLMVMDDLDGFKNIFSLANRYKVKKFVFASSSEVYGEPESFPEHEEHTPFNARLPYAVVKLCGETYARAYFESYKMPSSSLRFFNVYGPRQSNSGYGFVVGIFLRAALENKPLPIIGDGLQTRDFTYIDDVVDGLLRTLVIPSSNGEAFNLGTGKETSIMQLARTILKVTGSKSGLKFFPARKKGDMSRRVADIRKSLKVLRWRAKMPLAMGLRKTLDNS